MFIKLKAVATRDTNGSVEMHKMGKDITLFISHIESVETRRSVVYDSESKIVTRSGIYYYLKETHAEVEKLVRVALHSGGA